MIENVPMVVEPGYAVALLHIFVGLLGVFGLTAVIICILKRFDR